MREPVTVELGHFDALANRGLKEVLREDPSIRIADALGRTALESAGEPGAPAVIILDEANVSDLSALSRMRLDRPTIGIIVLADRPTRPYSIRLLAAGATCVSKDAPDPDILAAVHLAAAGRHFSGMTSLTVRQSEILAYLRTGRSYGEIARALQISTETVRTHSAVIRRKLGVRSKRELIATPMPGRVMRRGPETQRNEPKAHPLTLVGR